MLIFVQLDQQSYFHHMVKIYKKKDLLLFKSLRQGKDWFVVVTGRFPTSAKARQAVQNLPAAQSKASPWPREIKVIQQEIKQHK